jgi:hypothetical protein
MMIITDESFGGVRNLCTVTQLVTLVLIRFVGTEANVVAAY